MKRTNKRKWNQNQKYDHSIHIIIRNKIKIKMIDFELFIGKKYFFIIILNNFNFNMILFLFLKNKIPILFFRVFLNI